MFQYKAKVTNVVDGDTIDVDIDLGFYVHRMERVRLYGINAYETRLGKDTTAEEKAKGLEGKAYLTNLILGKEVVLNSFKSDDYEKYGRFLAEVLLGDLNVNEDMVTKGYAVHQVY